MCTIEQISHEYSEALGFIWKRSYKNWRQYT